MAPNEPPTSEEGPRGRPRSGPGVSSDPFERVESLALITRCRRGQKIYGSGEPAEHWYQVISGMARITAVLVDGRRRVIDFLMPRDFFFGVPARREQQIAVEAVVAGTRVARYPRRSVERLLQSEPVLGSLFLEKACETIARLHARTLVLGRMTAAQKVGSFLSELAERSPEGPDVVLLAMSRYDIADYLAVSVETVSRSLTYLRERGAISMAGAHRVEILDRAVLEDRSGPLT
jgi:CRP/FNR family transcriptional regulator, nitrogen fixation regulation protein